MSRWEPAYSITCKIFDNDTQNTILIFSSKSLP